MIRNLVQLNYNLHRIHISRDTLNNVIILFKYNDSRCDFAVYKSSEWDSAADYVLSPLPEGSWQFEPDGDEE